MKRRKVPRQGLTSWESGAEPAVEIRGAGANCHCPLLPRGVGGGVGISGDWGTEKGRVEIWGGVGRIGNGREVDAPQRGGDYLVVGARRHCRSGERRFVSKSWSLL